MLPDIDLMNRVGIIFLTYRRQLQNSLSEFGITLQQYRILKILARKEFLYPSEIADTLFCDRPTATVIIKNLQKKNWVRRERDQNNGKQIMIRITSDGLIKFRETRRVADRLFNQGKIFSDRELQQLNKLLMKLQNEIQVNGDGN